MNDLRRFHHAIGGSQETFEAIMAFERASVAFDRAADNALTSIRKQSTREEGSANNAPATDK